MVENVPKWSIDQLLDVARNYLSRGDTKGALNTASRILREFDPEVQFRESEMHRLRGLARTGIRADEKLCVNCGRIGPLDEGATSCCGNRSLMPFGEILTAARTANSDVAA